MRAEILLLPAGERDGELLTVAERVLGDVASAFGHVFVALRREWGTDADAMADECVKRGVCLASNARDKRFDALCEALATALRVRVFDVPEGVGEGAKRLWLAQVESLDEETLTLAFDLTKRIASREDLPVTHITPTGRTIEDWLARAASTLPDAQDMLASDAMTALIESPASLRLLLSPPSVGNVFRAAATALSPYPAFLRDLCLGGDAPLFAPCLPRGEGDVSPWGMILSCADLMRDGLGLTREADCVEAAVTNVLGAGWRTADIFSPGLPRVDARAIGDLISEQIELAGELLGKGASFHENPLS